MKTVWISTTRYYYDKITTTAHRAPDGRVWRGTAAEARAEIERLDGEVYHLGSGEYARPYYRARYDLPDYVRRELDMEKHR